MDKIFMQYPMIWAMLGGVMGMMAHILKKKVKGETAEAIVDYFTDNTRYTMLALIGMVVAVFTVYEPTMVWYKSMVVGIMAGLSCDSLFNKGKK